MYLVKPNGTSRKTWVIRQHDGPQITLPTKNKKEAERILKEKNDELKNKKFRASSPAIQFEALRDAAMALAKKKGQKEKNVKRGKAVMWARIIKYDESLPERTDLRFLTPKWISKFEQNRLESKRKPQITTIKREVQAIKAALKEVARLEQIPMPFADSHWPDYKGMPHTVKESQKGKRIPMEFLEPWLESLEGECKLRATFLLHTGMRREQCEELEIDMFEPPAAYQAEAYINYPARISKIKTANRIPLDVAAYHAIKDQIGDRKRGMIWSRSDFRKQMHNHAVKLGLPMGIHCRDLRHTFCNIAMQAMKTNPRINKYELSKYVGHKNAEQMNRYISPNDAEIIPIIRALSFATPRHAPEDLIAAVASGCVKTETRDLTRDLRFSPAVRRGAEDGLKGVYLAILSGGS